MLISHKWEEQRSRLQPHLQKIVNVPLPQQASKILQNFQSNCNSPNKAIQLEALKCWETWLQNYNSEEWEVDSVCHFAIKPLLTKKKHPLHKDADVCKLRLNIMWRLLVNVQSKMELSGPLHILESFLHSCFTWLSSIESLDSKVSILILKLLLILFRKCPEAVECDKYIFAPVSINDSALKMLLNSFIEKFLDVFDNLKQFQNNYLIIDLWKCFLEYCEISHNSILTTVWHRVFKVVQVFCSEKSKPVKIRLAFLHACATNVKTVLLSSKYISGEACFVTPCEALLKKLIQICRVDCEEAEDSEIFNMCEDICKVLSYKSVSICDYDLCTDFINAMYDFSLKSFFWGCWCGLMDCFKKTLLNVEISKYTRSQMKFYRKLRAATVNYELDHAHLHEDCAVNVRGNIKILNIRCYCSMEITEAVPKGPFSKGLASDSALVMKRAVRNEEFELTQELTSAIDNADSNQVLPFRSWAKTFYVTLNGDFGKFGHPDLGRKPRYPTINIFNETFNRVKKIFGASIIVLNKPFFGDFGNLQFSRLKYIDWKDQSQEQALNVFSPSFEASSPMKRPFEPPPEDGNEKIQVCNSQAGISDCSKRTTKTNAKKRVKAKIPSRLSQFSINEGEVITTARTRSQRKAEEEAFSKRKRRKSFEVLVQEIVKNNKLRKAEKNKCEKSVGVCSRRELRSAQKIDSSEKINNSTGKKKKSELQKNSQREKIFRDVDTSAKRNQQELKFHPLESKKNNKKNGKRKRKRSQSNRKKQDTVEPEFKEKSEEKEVPKNNIFDHEKESSKQRLDAEALIINTEMILKFSPFKDALLNHDYAKRIPSCEMHKTDFVKLFENRGEQSKRKEINSGEGKKDLEENKTEIALSESRTGEEISDKNSELSEFKESEEIVSEDEESEETKTQEDRNSSAGLIASQPENGRHVSHAKAENFSGESIIIEEKPSSVQVDESAPEESKDLNETEVKKEPEVEEKTSAKVNLLDGAEAKESAAKANKRFRTDFETEDADPVARKKQKLSEEDAAIEETAEKENVEIRSEEELVNAFSPDKSNSRMENPTGAAAVVDGPKVKGDSSPCGHPKPSAKVESRTTSSRALKMIALVPESDLRGRQTTWESSSVKMECKVQGRKYLGVDRSSRVSKMLLAGLTKIVPEEMEGVAAEDKSISEPTDPSTPNPPTAKISSPKTGKKRKFISFDESKNETIIYEIGAPPSQILFQREKSKESFCSPEKMAATAAILSETHSPSGN